jgi:magnesium chelatase accessory protein
LSEPLIWERDGPAWPNHAASGFVAAAGIRWHVQQMGEGPALLLVHGTGASTHSWRDLMPALSRRHRVIAVDLPGHGFTSGVPPVRSSLTGMSDSLMQLLKSLGVAPQFCAGHSAGAAILCRMALSNGFAPRSIASINGAFLPLAGAAGVLFAPIAKAFAAAPFVSRLIAWHASDRDRVRRVLASTGSNLDARGVDLYARLVRDPNHIAGALNMMANWDLESFEREISALRVPLSLIAAQNDRTVPPAQALRIRERLTQARFLSVPGLGHLAHEENPERFAQLLGEVFGAG